MKVERIHTDTGSHIEPPLDDSWDPLDKLRWHAAVTMHDCQGLTLEIRPCSGDLLFSVEIVGFGSRLAASFYDVWAYVNGIGAGWSAASCRALEGPEA